MKQLNSREEYLRLCRSIARENEEKVNKDPFQVANTMVASVNQTADPENGLTRTHGTADVDDRTLYPTDVAAYSEQARQKVVEFSDLNVEEARMIDIYATCSMAIDLKEIAEREPT